MDLKTTRINNQLIHALLPISKTPTIRAALRIEKSKTIHGKQKHFDAKTLLKIVVSNL